MKRLKALLAGLALGTLIGSLMDPERRARVKKISQELKVKLMQRAKTLSGITREAYEKMAETAVTEYHDIKSLSEEELKKITHELKEGWKDVHSTIKK